MPAARQQITAVNRGGQSQRIASFILDKSKPVVRRGRKAMGPLSHLEGGGCQVAEWVRSRNASRDAKPTFPPIGLIPPDYPEVARGQGGPALPVAVRRQKGDGK